MEGRHIITSGTASKDDIDYALDKLKDRFDDIDHIVQQTQYELYLHRLSVEPSFAAQEYKKEIKRIYTKYIDTDVWYAAYETYLEGIVDRLEFNRGQRNYFLSDGSTVLNELYTPLRTSSKNIEETIVFDMKIEDTKNNPILILRSSRANINIDDWMNLLTRQGIMCIDSSSEHRYRNK